MPPCHIIRVHVLETELAYVKHPIFAVLFRIWRSVPGVDLPATEIDAFDLARRGCLLVRPEWFGRVKCGLLHFPFFFSLDASIVEPLPVGGRRISLGCIGIRF
jgi:hypothetical protein